ncbi:hypothetical protein HZA42_05680 [Candidatus Peregrinibacteria bacterium]|nr:hypothetical protein [Candidatus Peregrinibacteria bacterium]
MPRNTLGVSSLVASLEDRLRAAGKTLPTLAGPTPQKGVFVRMEEFLEGVKPAERGPAGPLCDCETPDKEDEDELI